MQTVGRTQYQELYYTDPTVAAPGQWVFGINAEAWGVVAPLVYPVNTAVGSQTQTTYVSGFQGGGDLYIGYDNFLLQFQGLAGQSSTTFNAGAGASAFKTTFPSEQFDVSLRYSFSGVNLAGLTPFLIVGFDYLYMPVTDTLTSPGFFWIATGTPVRHRVYDYNTGYVGAGGLYEFNEQTGFRVDLDVGASWGAEKITNLLPGFVGDASGTGLAALGHATVYYHFLPEWTLQFGLKAAAISISNGIEPAGGVGGFMSVGYLHRF